MSVPATMVSGPRRKRRALLSMSLDDRAIQLGFVLVLLAIWQAVSSAGLVNRLLLPPPTQVATELRALLSSDDFWHDIWTSLSSIAVAYAIAVIGGITLGAAAGSNRFVHDVLRPVLSTAFAIPLIIVYPLILFLVGIGPASKIVFAAIYGFLPMALAATSAFANVPLAWRRYAATLTHDRWLVTRRVLIPAAMPELMSGLRVSYVVTFASVVAGEMIAAYAGVGRVISYNAEVLEPARMYAAIVVVVAFAALVNGAMSRLQRTGAPE